MVITNEFIQCLIIFRDVFLPGIFANIFKFRGSWRRNIRKMGVKLEHFGLKFLREGPAVLYRKSWIYFASEKLIRDEVINSSTADTHFSPERALFANKIPDMFKWKMRFRNFPESNQSRSKLMGYPV